MEFRRRRGEASPAPIERNAPDDIAPKAEPPVVARLMVEIRSDGTYTVARGAMEDAESGQRVTVEASGDNPLSLALSLAKSIATVPWLARHAFRSLVRPRG